MYLSLINRLVDSDEETSSILAMYSEPALIDTILLQIINASDQTFMQLCMHRHQVYFHFGMQESRAQVFPE